MNWSILKNVLPVSSDMKWVKLFKYIVNVYILIFNHSEVNQLKNHYAITYGQLKPCIDYMFANLYAPKSVR